MRGWSRPSLDTQRCLNVSGSTISNNSVSSGAIGLGGGIRATGTATISNSTVSNNSAPSGGGIAHLNEGTTTISGSTISNNSASSGDNNNGGGGGIRITQIGAINIRTSTIHGNSAASGAGGIRNDNAPDRAMVNIEDSIVAGNTGAGDIGGDFNDEGFNFLGGDPELGPLADNGGPTKTHLPLDGSPVIDQGDDGSPTPTTDQRGERRPQDDPAVTNAAGGDGSEIGAVEVEPLAFSVTDAARVTEGDAGAVDATFTVSLSRSSNLATQVDYAIVGDTATSPEDFDAATGTLALDAGQTEKTVTVPVKGDALDEITETFFVELSNAISTPAGFVSIANGSGQGTIVDNDAPPSLSVSDVSVTEGDAGTTDATFTATLSAPSGKTVSVDYATADGTADGSATAGEDYASASGDISFRPGVETRTVTVSVKADTAVEPDETFLLNLSGESNATLADGQAEGTILNDDAPNTAPPTADDDSYETAENTALVVEAPGVLANDTDPDGDALTAVKLSEPASGTLAFNADGSFRYAPDSGFLGTDSFTYKASGGGDDSNIATVTITVRDETAPTVTAATPKAGTKLAKASANVTATFSEAIDRSTLTNATFILVRKSTGDKVEATLGYASSRNRAILNPKEDLVAGAAYTATVKGGADGVKDAASNALAEDRVWTFSVNSAPKIEVLDPEPGSSTTNRKPTIKAVVKDAQSILPASNIKLTLDGTEITTFTYNKSTGVLRYTPSENLSLGGHEVKIEARDPQGLSSSRTWSFSVVQ